jgi:hypothetical protein
MADVDAPFRTRLAGLQQPTGKTRDEFCARVERSARIRTGEEDENGL